MFYNQLYTRQRVAKTILQQQLHHSTCCCCSCSGSGSGSGSGSTSSSVILSGFTGGIKRIYITTPTYTISMTPRDLVAYIQFDYIVKVPCVITLPKGMEDLISVPIHIRNVSEHDPLVKIQCDASDLMHHLSYLPPTGGSEIYLPEHHKFEFILTDYENQLYSWTIT